MAMPPPSSFRAGSGIGVSSGAGSVGSSSSGGGLRPIPANKRHLTDPGVISRRVSRTDLDFEQALAAGGTVLLREGPDLSSLGVLDTATSTPTTSPTPTPNSKRAFSTPSPSPVSRTIGAASMGRMGFGQPSTPTVVPPTPTPAVGSSSGSSPYSAAGVTITTTGYTATSAATSARTMSPAPKISLTRSQSPSGASSSSNERYFDAEESEMQTRRRSMFRSPGSASSPDLATLVRKAKERSVAGGGEPQNQGQNGSSSSSRREEKNVNEAERAGQTRAPEPGRDSFTAGRTRPRSSTTVNRPAMSSNKGKLTKNQKNTDTSGMLNPPISSDWVMTSPRSRTETLIGKGKSSVRSKTSAFLGKIIGQSSLRDKSSRYDYFSSSSYVPPSYSSSSYYDTDAPPVPPLPRNHRSPIGSPIADVFRRSPDMPNTPNTGKPLPPIQFSPQKKQEDVNESDDDEKSIVVVERTPSVMRSSSPDRTIKAKSPLVVMRDGIRKRSVSVSEADVKRAVAAASNEAATAQNEWGSNSSFSGVIKDFTGELSSQFDPISSSSLDLKDPSTPKKNAVQVEPPTSPIDMKSRPQLRMVSSPTTLTRHGSTSGATDSMSASRTNSVKYGPRQPRPGSGSIFASPGATSNSAALGRDANRLRVQHRSSASSSEPSLIPVRDDDRIRDPKRSVRLVPSSTSVGWPEATSPALSVCLSSQTDLTGEETSTSRVPSSAASREESVDIETRGKDLATKCWTEDEEFLAKEKIAEWLGGIGLVNKIALKYYMDYFDFSGLRLDFAFRRLCAKLYLKAETQQVDRILEEFSRRYWATNPGTIYGSSSVVHAVSYSLLLLNTDLHVAELAQRMSRSQFVRNTLTAIQMQIRPNTVGRPSTPDLTYDDGSSIRGVGSDGSEHGGSGSTLRSRGKRSGSVTSWNSISRDIVNTPATTPNSGTSQTQLNGSTCSIQEPRIKNPSVGSVVYGRNFDSEMESLLKEMYSAIKSQQILQPVSHLNATERTSISSLSPGPHHTLMRKRSQRGPNDRVNNLKRGSVRGIQTLFNAQAGVSPYGAGNLDGRLSPAPSFVSSAHDINVANFAASNSQFLPPTLGFASNLSHTIIREAQEDDDRSIRSDDSGSTSVSITDEELALFGAPWAKEGMLCRKQYWELSGKRAKSKQWMDVFVVIQKGELNMFIFGSEGGGGATMGVGGGNWLANARPVGTVSLSHSLAHALPPPGYSRQRPYCFVLTLSSGGVYFFQAGTEELVNEWVSTCNYWAARLSKEPLAGGVSNMEYGWNRVDVSDRLPGSVDAESLPPKDPDPSDTFSMRSGRSRLSKKDAFSMRSSPHFDRIFIHDWKPPIPSSVASTHDEEAQLEALQKQVASLKDELNEHNALRALMQQLYQHRSSNANKANANWERKSQYLLTEIVKYDSYVDSLKAAMSLRLKKRGDKALEKALVVVNPDEESGASGKRWKGYPEEETIPEGEEPPLTPGLVNERSSSQHRRETAGVSDI